MSAHRDDSTYIIRASLPCVKVCCGRANQYIRRKQAGMESEPRQMSRKLHIRLDAHTRR